MFTHVFLGGTCCSSFQVSLLQCGFFSLSLSSPVSVALNCLFLIALSIYSNVYCHSHFIPPFFLRPCQLLIVYSWLHFRFTLTFIAIAISSPRFCLRPCQLWIVYSWLHFRLSLTIIAIAILSPLFCLHRCQLWIVYSWLHFRFSLTFTAIEILTHPLFFNKTNFHVGKLIE